MRRAATAGAIAVLAAIGTAELLSALVPAAPSPLDAVGQQVVAWLPGGVLTTAIDVLGMANRTVLTTLSVLVAVVFGALLGAAAVRSRTIPLVVFAGVGVLVGIAMRAQPGAGVVGVVVVVAGAVLVATTALRRLLAATNPHGPPYASTPAARAAGPHHAGPDHAGAGFAPPGEPDTDNDPGAGAAGTSVSPTDPGLGRRDFLRLAAGVGVLGVGAGALGRALHGAQGGAGVADPSQVTLPPVTHPLPPVPAGTDLARRIDGLAPLLTPNDAFFRIDTAIVLPRVDPDRWSLRIHGHVERPIELTYDELVGRGLQELDATIVCVSNEVGGELIGTARWAGIPLVELLDEAGTTDAAEQVLGRSVDGWTGGFPLEHVAQDGRALVAVAMNGEPLPVRHGFPARLVVPGLYGYVSATKWLAEIELTAWEGVDGYWIPRGWAKQGPVKTASRIDVPGSGSHLAAGEVTFAGVAWAPAGGIDAVEVQVDNGPWHAATLAPALGDTTWVQWSRDLPLTVGSHDVRVRAVDGEGRLQPQGPAPPSPDGAEGWHQVRVEVA